MPDISVMMWNVQNFGFANNRFRGNYGPVCRFIARAARQQNADIIFIQELKQNGVARLAQLQLALNNAYATAAPAGNWYYDSIKAAFAAGLAGGPNTNVTTAAQLDWTGPANREGYAMFWNRNAAKFTMLAAPTIAGAANTQSNGVRPLPLPMGVPAHALSLVLQGRPPAPDPFSPWAYQSAGFNPPANIPAWNNLNFPNRWGIALVRNASRRPCYCTIDVNIAGPPPAAQRIVPIMSYHAPSNSANLNAPPAGTQISAFSRQMYQAQNPAAAWGWINNARAIAGGDFNVDMNPPGLAWNREESYEEFTDAFAAGVAGGAACHENVPVQQAIPINNTVVSLDQWIGGPPIQVGAINAYRTSEFDNIFWRGFTGAPPPARGRVYDLLTAVRPGGSLVGGPITGFLGLLNAGMGLLTIAPGAPYVGMQPCNAAGNLLYPDILNFAAFHADVTAGQMSSSRRAAEFVRLFISDHLPIVFRFTEP
ncbi:MAG: endonuclease/exonuclease/phosphatase family protein [Blastocatellia bacterium]